MQCLDVEAPQSILVAVIVLSMNSRVPVSFASQLVMFGLHYWMAEVIVGARMVGYVFFGGMAATIWVQIIKAVLLLGGVTFMAVTALAQSGFSPKEMFRRAVDVHSGALSIKRPGKLLKDPLNARSLGSALMFGTAGFPLS
jgi:cation/acetate symporter